MRRFGLVGNPLTHSWSEPLFRDLFRKNCLDDCRYELFPKPTLENFRQWISEQKDLYGLNITIPFKTEVMHLLDEIDPVARETGAVNTIKICLEKGAPWLKGFNTDVDGFMGMLPDPFLHEQGLILGNGGASKAVAFVFRKMGIDFMVVSRNNNNNESLTYPEITEEVIKNATVIVNATPLGMYPDTMEYPRIPYEEISQRHLLIDLIYNPAETLFLKFGKARRAQTMNGSKMLQIQAEKAMSIFISG